MADDHPADGSGEASNLWPLTLANLDGSRIEIDPDRVLNLGDVPWNTLRHAFLWGKKTFVTDDRSNVPTLRVDATKSEIQEVLGRRYFEPNWEFSTYYAGEVLNLRRVQFVAHDRITWWQIHIRGFQDGESLELDPHWEPEPTEHPDAHLSEAYISVERGIEMLEHILSEADVAYEHLDRTNDAD